MKPSSMRLLFGCGLFSYLFVMQSLANSAMGYSVESKTSIGRIGIAGIY